MVTLTNNENLSVLHKFLSQEREGILALCAEKLLFLSDERSSSAEMETGLPVFYDELIEVLRADQEETTSVADRITDGIHRDSAVRRGKESLRLGYTISQVVHGYGALCQSITEFAHENLQEPINVREFNRLNFCLDVAIAEAVTEFNLRQRDTSVQEEVQRLGFLAHELRNALGNASTAHMLIKKGVVGFAGSTSKVLEDALGRMKDLIDRSLSEVRLRGQPTIDTQRCRVVDLVGRVEITSMFEAEAKSVRLIVEVPPELTVDADPHLVISAISNLVQNAIKFNKTGGRVWIRSKAVDGRILMEIEDECGGLPSGSSDEMFHPFSQKGIDRTGVGLGLSISSRAIELNKGRVSVRDVPGKCCVFTIDLPQAPLVVNEAEETILLIQ